MGDDLINKDPRYPIGKFKYHGPPTEEQREQAEDDEQGMQAQSPSHHVGHDDVTLDLVDCHEEEHDPERGDGVGDEGQVVVGEVASLIFLGQSRQRPRE